MNQAEKDTCLEASPLANRRAEQRGAKTSRLFRTIWSTEDALFELFDRSISGARIRFLLPDRTVDVGRAAGPVSNADFVLRVTDPNFAAGILRAGNLGLAESYMEEGWRLETGTLEDFLSVLARARMEEKLRVYPRIHLHKLALRLIHLLSSRRSKIDLHYSAGDDLFELFLGDTMTYTCGYQKSPDDTLDQLQKNKFERVCQKIRLREGDTLLDIGCGWGGFLIHAAQNYGVKARGVTLSKSQARYAAERARKLGLDNLVSVHYGDYKEERGSYNKVVSLGMFEHLYPREHAVYFRRIRELLAGDGWGLVHFMSCVGPRNEPDPFVQKYIFPGSTHPHLSSSIRQLESNDLGVLDVENIGPHYLPTSRAWLANFRANRNRIDPVKYDSRFVRMYEYLLSLYVAACEARVGALFQVLFTKDYRANVPVHRV